MTSCPCCSSLMLRRVRQGKVYWFCRTCWQEMPLLTVDAQHPAPAESAPTLNSVKEGDLKHFLMNRRETSRVSSKPRMLAAL